MTPADERLAVGHELDRRDQDTRQILGEVIAELRAGGHRADAFAAVALLLAGGPSADSASRTASRMGLPMSVVGLRDVIAGRTSTGSVGADPVRQVLALRVAMEGGMRGVVGGLHGGALREDAHPVVRSIAAEAERVLFPGLVATPRPLDVRIGCPRGARPVFWCRPSRERMLLPLLRARRAECFALANQEVAGGATVYLSPAQLWEMQVGLEWLDLAAWYLAREIGVYHVEELLLARGDGRMHVRVIGAFDWERLAAGMQRGWGVQCRRIGRGLQFDGADWSVMLAEDSEVLAAAGGRTEPFAPGGGVPSMPDLWCAGVPEWGVLGDFVALRAWWESAGARLEVDFSSGDAALAWREALVRAAVVVRQRADETLHEAEAIEALDAALAGSVLEVAGEQIRVRLERDWMAAAVRVQARLFDWRLR